MKKILLIEEEFIAKGNETFLVIGNFELQRLMNYEAMPKKKEHWNWKDSYYFIDNISLIEIEKSVIVEKIATTEIHTDLKTLAKGKTIVMENVLFQTEKHDLLPSSFPTLDSIVTIMTENKLINIIIEGHTDNNGDSLKNMKLSFLRAETVKNYLVSSKIATKRIEIAGFGAMIPLLPNTTSRGRRRNRRVSIRIK